MGFFDKFKRKKEAKDIVKSEQSLKRDLENLEDAELLRDMESSFMSHVDYIVDNARQNAEDARLGVEKKISSREEFLESLRNSSGNMAATSMAAKSAQEFLSERNQNNIKFFKATNKWAKLLKPILDSLELRNSYEKLEGRFGINLNQENIVHGKYEDVLLQYNFNRLDPSYKATILYPYLKDLDKNGFIKLEDYIPKDILNEYIKHSLNIDEATRTKNLATFEDFISRNTINRYNLNIMAVETMPVSSFMNMYLIGIRDEGWEDIMQHLDHDFFITKTLAKHFKIARELPKEYEKYVNDKTLDDQR